MRIQAFLGATKYVGQSLRHFVPNVSLSDWVLLERDRHSPTGVLDPNILYAGDGLLLACRTTLDPETLDP